MLTPPPAVIVPNAWAKQRGLTMAATFGGGTARPYLTRGAVEATFTSPAAPGLSGGVVGMVGTSGYWQAVSGAPTYTLPTARGTVVVVARSATDSGGGVRRYLFSAGNVVGFPVLPFFGMADFDNNLHVGWANSGTDGRITVSSLAGALWSAGATIVITLAYGAAGQTLYVNGVQKGTGAFAGYGDTSAATFAVGQLDTFGAPWLTATGDAIYSALAFDQELTPGEVARISDDPWIWARRLGWRTKITHRGTTFLGVFDPEIVPQAWFDPVIRPLGWWDRDLVDVAAAGGGVTVAVTGVSATGAVGTLAPSTTVPLTGVAGTGAVGSVGAALTVPISGVAGTGAVGGVTPSTSVALTGVAATGAVGGVTPSTALAITGVVATGAVGSVSVDADVTVALTGVSATGAVGDVGVEAAPQTGDTHDGFIRRSRRERRLDTLRARRDDERLADAQALRAALERALDGAEDIPAPQVVQAVEAAPKPAEVDWQRIAERDEDYARLSRMVTRLTAMVEAEAKRRADDDDDDDEEAMFLMGAA